MTEEKSKSSKKLFLSGVAVMTLSTAIVKIIGLLYKIPMLAFLGKEGMAFFMLLNILTNTLLRIFLVCVHEGY